MKTGKCIGKPTFFKKSFLGTALILAVSLGCVAGNFVNGVRVDGAAPGEWTHDWDAASAAAKKDGKPIFINFTGSDWCGWCKLLKRQVFTQPEWGSWASNNVYLVHVDFPNDKELVPEKYRDRNRELSRRYKVGGYPTCYLLDSATLEPLGRFGASRDLTASGFIEKVSAAMAATKSDPPAGMPSGDRTVQGSTVATNDFKAVLTGVAVVDDKRRHKYGEAAFVPPETKVVVPYGKTALFRVEYHFPEGYAARVWTRDGLCDDGKIHSWYFGSNPSGMFKGKGTAYGFLHLLDRGKTCRVRELLLRTGVAPELDRSPSEWTIAAVPVDIEFLEKPANRETDVGGVHGMPVGKFPVDGLVSKFVFDDANKANDLVKKGRQFQVGGVPPRGRDFRPADDLVKDGALQVNGEYKWESLPHLDVPELRYDRFSVALSFRPHAEGRHSMPLVSFGGGWRWFHVFLRADGTATVSFRGLEKGEMSFPLPEKIRLEDWNWMAVSFDGSGHSLSVVLNGRRLPVIALPSDFAFQISREDREKSRNVQFANTNGGSVFKGEIGEFLLFDRAFSDEELDAIAVPCKLPAAPWKFSSDKEGAALYWNGTVSDGDATLEARIFNNAVSVAFPDRLSVPNGMLDLCKPVLDANGKTVPLIGIGPENDASHVGFGGRLREAATVRLPASLRYIGPGAFERFVSLTQINCPDSVRMIGSAAFDDCRSLRQFRLGRGVEDFSSDRVFMGCDKLEMIEVAPENRHFKTVDGALFSADGKRLVAFPPGRNGPFSIPSGVEEIPSRAFLGCHGLTRISIPASVKKIGGYAFVDCPALERIEFENRSFKLDDSVFGASRKGEQSHRPETNLLP